MTHEITHSVERIINPRTLLMGAFLTAALVDTRWSGVERRQYDDQARLVSTDSNKDLSIISLVGNGASGQQYARQLGPHLEEFGSSHFVVYPDKGFSTESIADRIREASQKDKHKRKALFVSSMGELVFNHLMIDTDLASDLGQVDYLISNDGVTNLSNLQPRIQKLLRVGAHVPVTKTTTSMYSLVRKAGAHKPLPHSPEISDELALQHAISTASTPLYAMSAQWRNMLHYSNLQPGSLTDFGSTIAHKVHITSPHDNVVDAQKSIADKRAVYGQFEQIIDRDMPYGSHAMGAEFPRYIKHVLGRRTEATLQTEEQHDTRLFELAA